MLFQYNNRTNCVPSIDWLWRPRHFFYDNMVIKYWC